LVYLELVESELKELGHLIFDFGNQISTVSAAFAKKEVKRTSLVLCEVDKSLG
jgi:hypothetical protein